MVTDADFLRMMTNRCGSGNLLARKAVEAYSRYICRPGRVYHYANAPEKLLRALTKIDRDYPSITGFNSVPST